MISGILLAWAMPALAAYCIARWGCPLPASPGRTLLHVSLAAGLMLGLSSLSFFLWAACRGPLQPGLTFVETILFGALAVLAWRAARRDPTCPAVSAERCGRSSIPWGLWLAFGLVLLAMIGVSGWYLQRSPHGSWDAWAIWNLRARFLARGGEHWTAAFSPLIFWSHPDYPLLVPGAIARCWVAAGLESTLVPRLVAVLFGAATVGLLAATLALLRDPMQGCLAGMVLLATPEFLELMTAQYADVPLGFFMLASVALFEMRDRGGVGRLALLAGLFTGLAAWTKNEGLLELTVTALLRLMRAVRGPRQAVSTELALFTLGLLPVAVVLLYFKQCLVPTNDLIAGQGGTATLARLTDVPRYATIAFHFLWVLVQIGPGAVVLLAGYALLLGRAPASVREQNGRHTGRFLSLTLLGYAAVYVTSPTDLRLHLSLSADRLFMQLWPTFLLLFFLRIATPAEAAQRATK